MNQPTVRERSTSGKDLLAAVALQIDQHRLAGAADHAAGTSRATANTKPGQQHLVDAAMEGRRHPGQQRAP